MHVTTATSAATSPAASWAVGGLKLPNLEKLGLGNIKKIEGVETGEECDGRVGIDAPVIRGEGQYYRSLGDPAGGSAREGVPDFPKGFPREVLEAFASKTGRGVIGNVVSSGTAVIAKFADEQRKTGAWMRVDTSADSVFQIAAHEKVIPLDELYAACEMARDADAAIQRVPRHRPS